MYSIILIGAGALVVFSTIIFIVRRYKRCPSNKILVIFGKVGGEKSARCIHGGGTFVLPLIQDYEFMSLEPLTLEVPLQGALSQNNIRVNVPSSFTVAISNKQEIMLNAAERLLGLSEAEVSKQAEDIIIGQLRFVIATMTIEEINKDRDKFLTEINNNVDKELNKIGLSIINVNIKDLSDDSGYIEAIGKKAAAEAINKANVEVAEEQKKGAIGTAAAHKDQNIEVAQANAQTEIGKQDALKNQRVNVAELNAEAVSKENEAKATIAESNASLGVKTAQAAEQERVAIAKANQNILAEEKVAETARLQKDQIVMAEIDKEKKIIFAEADASQRLKLAQGEAASILAIKEAEAKGIEKVMSAKAEGYKQLMENFAENPTMAATMLMIEKAPELAEIQVKAIKDLKIDKITVWDGGGSNGTGLKPFLKDFTSVLPGMHELLKQVGIDAPDFMGSMKNGAPHIPASDAESIVPPGTKKKQPIASMSE